MKIAALFLLLTASLTCGATPPAATPAPPSATHACCPEKPAVKAEEKSCCTPDAAAATASIENSFTRDSLYQSDAVFTDDSGKSFTLGSLRGQPVALNMFFASCGYACPLTVTDLLAIQGRLPAGLRSKARFVLVSFDIARDTPEALAKYRAQRGLNDQWILLHGTDDAVRELAALLGVKYKQEADGSFAHSNLITILNAEGEIVHQRTGLQGGLAEAATAFAAAEK